MRVGQSIWRGMGKQGQVQQESAGLLVADDTSLAGRDLGA